MTENNFRWHFSSFQINAQLFIFLQNGRRRPFWMTENHFRSQFSPFQINTQHFGSRFFPKSIGTYLNSRSLATSNMKSIGVFLIKLWSAQAFFIIFSQNGRWWPFWFFRFAPKSIGFFHSRSSMAVSIMNLICALVSQLRETQALACGGGDGDGDGPKP